MDPSDQSRNKSHLELVGQCLVLSLGKPLELLGLIRERWSAVGHLNHRQIQYLSTQPHRHLGDRSKDLAIHHLSYKRQPVNPQRINV